ncbi:MAG: glycosyltransferase family 9 protein [Actinobacteria bacterium]|nr:MAG: glycosyltransferase family 9 protein [Actinomycetota bacterium]
MGEAVSGTPRQWSEEWREALDVLCVRLDTVGDVLMTTPAMKALKQARPGRRLTLLTSRRGAAIAPLVPEIDEVVAYDPPWMKATGPRTDVSADRMTIDRLRAMRFDAAVIFTVYSQNPQPASLLCYLADVPLRLAHSRENPYGLLTHWVAEPEPERFIRHEVRRQLDLVREVGCGTSDEGMSLSVPDAGRERVAALLAPGRLDPAQPWVVLHSGASAASRRWPPKKFAELARQLARRGVKPVLTGTASERAVVETIADASDGVALSLAGLLGLGELAALIELTPLVVSNNTAPVHMAAALGTPVVDLYALTNPQHTPWGVPNRVLNRNVDCKYCYKSVCPERHHRCLAGVTVSEVAKASMSLLAETTARAKPKVAL